METRENQKELWDSIAPEWHDFKTNPGENAMKFLKLQTGKILDHGSGSGRHLSKIKNGKMYLVDFSYKMLEFAKKRAKESKIPAEFIQSNLEKLPFEDNFFDGAISISSIHCVETSEKRKKSIEELYRVLKQGAHAIIAVWNKDSKRFKNAGKEKYVGWRDKGKRYYYLFDEDEIYNLFIEAGFIIIKKLHHNVNIDFIVQKPKA